MEELILAIQNGEDKTEELFLENIGLIRKVASKYCRICPKYDCSVDKDDLMQMGYFALVQAAKTFICGEDNSWAHWAVMYLSAAMRRCIGIDGKIRPERFSISIDEPFEGKDGPGDRLLDLIADESWIPQEERVITEEHNSELFTLIQESLARLNDEKASYIINKYDLEGVSISVIAEEYHVSKQAISDKRQDAFKRLRLNSKLKAAYIEILGLSEYKHKGVHAVLSTGSSIVEDAVMRKERIRKLKKEMERDFSALERVFNGLLQDCQTDEEKEVYRGLYTRQKAEIQSKYKALEAESA